MRELHRFIGLELSGAKSERTAIAALEYYPKEKKIFLLEIYDRLSGSEQHSPDEALIHLLNELKEGEGKAQETWLGINVPLTLPPCLQCSARSCNAPGKCTNRASRWMRSYIRRKARGASKKAARLRQITPYTQRPVELWLRHEIVSELPEAAQFEIDEAMGGTKAPLTARMNFLGRCLQGFHKVEVLPKLTTALLALELEIPKRTLAAYRHLEQGAHARAEILEELSHTHDIFVYERDQAKLAQSLAAFDAFICAYTALLSATGRCRKAPHGFPTESGWIEFPA